MNTAAKKGLDALRMASKKVAHKATEATNELTGNKIAEKLWNLLIIQGVKKGVEGIKKEKKERRNIEWIKASIMKWNFIKYRSY